MDDNKIAFTLSKASRHAEIQINGYFFSRLVRGAVTIGKLRQNFLSGAVRTVDDNKIALPFQKLLDMLKSE